MHIALTTTTPITTSSHTSKISTSWGPILPNIDYLLAADATDVAAQ